MPHVRCQRGQPLYADILRPLPAAISEATLPYFIFFTPPPAKSESAHAISQLSPAPQLEPTQPARCPRVQGIAAPAPIKRATAAPDRRRQRRAALTRAPAAHLHMREKPREITDPARRAGAKSGWPRPVSSAGDAVRHMFYVFLRKVVDAYPVKIYTEPITLPSSGGTRLMTSESRSFSECLRDIAAKHGWSSDDLAKFGGYKSRTSIIRLFQEQSSHKNREAFLRRLCGAGVLKHEEESALRKALEISAIGKTEARARQILQSLIMGTRDPRAVIFSSLDR